MARGAEGALAHQRQVGVGAPTLAERAEEDVLAAWRPEHLQPVDAGRAREHRAGGGAQQHAADLVAEVAVDAGLEPAPQGVQVAREVGVERRARGVAGRALAVGPGEVLAVAVSRRVSVEVRPVVEAEDPGVRDRPPVGVPPPLRERAPLLRVAALADLGGVSPEGRDPPVVLVVDRVVAAHPNLDALGRRGDVDRRHVAADPRGGQRDPRRTGRETQEETAVGPRLDHVLGAADADPRPRCRGRAAQDRPLDGHLGGGTQQDRKDGQDSPDRRSPGSPEYVAEPDRHYAPRRAGPLEPPGMTVS